MFKKDKDNKLLPQSSDFERSSSKKTKNIPFSILGSQTFFEGKIVLKGETRIAGHVDGIVIAEDILVIEDGAKIHGEIHGTNVEICGGLNGSVHVSETLRIASTACVEGEVCAFKLIVEEGAKLRGKIMSLVNPKEVSDSNVHTVVETP